METEDADLRKLAISNLLAPIFRANGVRSVFHHRETILLRQSLDRLHPARLPGKVDRDHYLGQTSAAVRQLQFFGQADRRKIVCSWIDVHEVDAGPAESGTVCG